MIKFTGKLGVAVGVFSLLLWQMPVYGQKAAAKPAYIGVEACGKCHKRNSTGNQLAQWKNTTHAKAYYTLASPQAKKIAQEKGIVDPQKDGKCLKCHVAAYGADPSLIAPTKEGKTGFLVEDGVQCEVCHGPGSLYKPRKIMKDREASIATGLILPDKKLCISCHNEESPTYKKFNFEEMWKKIDHPNPKNAASEEG